MTAEVAPFDADAGWREVVEALAACADLGATARASGAFARRRGVGSPEALLRLALAWGPGQMSLREAAAWAGMNGVARLCDSALLRRLRKAAGWLKALVDAVVTARAPAMPLAGRPIRLVDGTTFGVVGQSRPGYRLHAGFDLGGERFGSLLLTSARDGEKLERVPVGPGEVVVADKGFARPDGLRSVVDRGADVLVRAGHRSLKLANRDSTPFDLSPVLAEAGAAGVAEADVLVGHGSRSGFEPLTLRLVAAPLPPEAAEAARKRLLRAGQREGYAPSAEALEAAGFVLLVTSLDHATAPAALVLDLYRLRWQVELAFKRLKSLLDMRIVPAKGEQIARTWLYAHLLVALLCERFGAEIGADRDAEAGAVPP